MLLPAHLEHSPWPEVVLALRAVHLDARHDGELAHRGVDRGLEGALHLPQDALVGGVRQLHKVGHLAVGEMADELLLDEGLLHVGLLELERDLAALDLALHGEEGAARRRGVLAPVAHALAHRALGVEGNVGGDPEHVALLAVHDGSVSHGGLEAGAAAEDEAGERRDVEVVTPLGIKVLGEGAAELVAARRHEVDARLGREAVLVEDLGRVVDEDALGNSAGEGLLEDSGEGGPRLLRHVLLLVLHAETPAGGHCGPGVGGDFVLFGVKSDSL
mmetsp:Transcript_60376/g.148529  ORF Transcript_60376/g.148529 Transcript_60376/m.148529 type:complete len:274 (+) Transcript_60376:361-1182(+)